MYCSKTDCAFRSGLAGDWKSFDKLLRVTSITSTLPMPYHHVLQDKFVFVDTPSRLPQVSLIWR